MNWKKTAIVIAFTVVLFWGIVLLGSTYSGK